MTEDGALNAIFVLQHSRNSDTGILKHSNTVYSRCKIKKIIINRTLLPFLHKSNSVPCVTTKQFNATIRRLSFVNWNCQKVTISKTAIWNLYVFLGGGVVSRNSSQSCRFLSSGNTGQVRACTVGASRVGA